MSISGGSVDNAETRQNDWPVIVIELVGGEKNGRHHRYYLHRGGRLLVSRMCVTAQISCSESRPRADGCDGGTRTARRNAQ